MAELVVIIEKWCLIKVGRGSKKKFFEELFDETKNECV